MLDGQGCDGDELPSEFSMMRGCFPSIMATAELVVPKSIPMTAPLTFSSALSAYPRAANDEAKGDLMVDGAAARRTPNVARGRTCSQVSSRSMDADARKDLQLVIILTRT